MFRVVPASRPCARRCEGRGVIEVENALCVQLDGEIGKVFDGVWIGIGSTIDDLQATA